MAQYDVDLVVIGGGPGATRPQSTRRRWAAKWSVWTSTAPAAPAELGLYSDQDHHRVGRCAGTGQSCRGLRPQDYGRGRLRLCALMARKDKVVATLVGGVEFLFKKNKSVSSRARGS